MDASSLSMAMMGISMAGAGVSAYGQYEQGRAQKAAYDYNADVALKKMTEEQQTSEAHFAQLMGRQRSLYAKAGVDITSGSPLLVMANTAMIAEEEQQRIKSSGMTEAQLQRYYGDVSAYGGKMGAMTTFLTGLGRAGLGYARTKKGFDMYGYGMDMYGGRG